LLGLGTSATFGFGDGVGATIGGAFAFFVGLGTSTAFDFGDGVGATVGGALAFIVGLGTSAAFGFGGAGVRPLAHSKVSEV